MSAPAIRLICALATLAAASPVALHGQGDDSTTRGYAPAGPSSGAAAPAGTAGQASVIATARAILQPGRSDDEVSRDQIGVLRYETQILIEDFRKSIRKGANSPFSASSAEAVEDTLEAIAGHLGWDAAWIGAAKTSSAWARYSKAPQHGYSVEDRRHDLERSFGLHRDAIVDAETFVSTLRQRHPSLA